MTCALSRGSTVTASKVLGRSLDSALLLSLLSHTSVHTSLSVHTASRKVDSVNRINTDTIMCILPASSGNTANQEESPTESSILSRSLSLMEREFTGLSNRVLQSILDEMRHTAVAQVVEPPPSEERYGEIHREEIVNDLTRVDGYPPQCTLPAGAICDLLLSDVAIDHLEEARCDALEDGAYLSTLLLLPDEYIVYYGYTVRLYKYDVPQSNGHPTMRHHTYSRFQPFLITNYCNLYHIVMEERVNPVFQYRRDTTQVRPGLQYDQSNPNLRLSQHHIQLLQSIPRVHARAPELSELPPPRNDSSSISNRIDSPPSAIMKRNGGCANRDSFFGKYFGGQNGEPQPLSEEVPDVQHPAILFHKKLAELLQSTPLSEPLFRHCSSAQEGRVRELERKLSAAEDRMRELEGEVLTAEVNASELEEVLLRSEDKLRELRETNARLQTDADELSAIRRLLSH